MNTDTQTILVTGAAGFIGSAVCRMLRSATQHPVVGIDKMTYAATSESLACLKQDPLFTFVKADICDASALQKLFADYAPSAVMHLAAETHVDRSIDNASAFIQSNIVGTYVLLEAARAYWERLAKPAQKSFRFLHVSTDEVYGALENSDDPLFTEENVYAPNSPYAASKASADHLVRAWHKTYGLPVVISNCSNNYGPFQFPEKLIPLCIEKAIKGHPIPIYGTGDNVRDWLYVEDHAEALYTILTRGNLGEKYNVGGASERRNIDLVTDLCTILDRLRPSSSKRPYSDMITFVADRPGHDKRYGMDFSKCRNELGWTPRTSLHEGLEKTVAWYLANTNWCDMIRNRTYDGKRLGVGRAL